MYFLVSSGGCSTEWHQSQWVVLLWREDNHRNTSCHLTTSLTTSLMPVVMEPSKLSTLLSSLLILLLLLSNTVIVKCFSTDTCSHQQLEEHFYFNVFSICFFQSWKYEIIDFLLFLIGFPETVWKVCRGWFDNEYL